VFGSFGNIATVMFSMGGYGLPHRISLLIAALEELNLWGIVGAKGIKLLTSSSLEAG